MLSIIVPCYNEEASLPIFYETVHQIGAQIQHELEFIFVNDGSKDQTLTVLKSLHAQDPARVQYLSFSRNFGKEAALYAGLQAAKGDLVTVMDADLQDPPELLPQMIELLETQAIDCVGTRRLSRTGESKVRSFFAHLFYRIINRISDTEIVDGARDFRLMTRQMVDAILELNEYNRFSKGLFSWVGFETHYLAYENKERVAGETSWSFMQLLNYSIDGIINFSDAPLNLASFIGALCCALAGIALVFIVVRTLLFGERVSGWPSMVCITLFLGGVQLLSIGIIGKYIGKIFLETKHRPVYIVKESTLTKNDTK